MKRIIKFFVLLAGLVILSGCAHQSMGSRAIAEKNQCLQKCAARFTHCKKQCVDNCSTCSLKSYNDAQQDLSVYKNEQKVWGGSVDRDLNSYRDPLQCQKTTCDCVKDVNVCNQNCKGTIYKSLQPIERCTSI